MKGFKIAFIICFALSGFFFLTGLLFPPLFVSFVFALVGGIVFCNVYKKTARNRAKAAQNVEAVNVDELVADTVSQLEIAETDWTCSCGSVNNGRFCPACGSAKPIDAIEAVKADETVVSEDDASEPIVEEAKPIDAIEAVKSNETVVSEDNASEPIVEEAQPSTVVSSINESGEEVIDLSPYTVHEEKVEYDPTNTKYKFMHATGLAGSMIQAFVDKKMQKCPYCCKHPVWDFTQLRLKTWRGNINVFKCSECEGVFSISVMDITTALDLTIGYETGLNLVNMLAKKKAGKEAHTAYVSFEYVGKSGVSSSIQGKEIRLQDAQEIANRR